MLRSLSVIISLSGGSFLFLVLSNLIGAHKWIATGPKSKALHKEELGVSVTEQKLKQQVEEKAASSLTGKAQMHRTVEMLKRQSATAVSPWMCQWLEFMLSACVQCHAEIPQRFFFLSCVLEYMYEL